MKCILVFATAPLLLSLAAASIAAPVMGVVRAVQGGTALLQNGGFEEVRDGRPLHWQPAPKGCQVADEQGRGGSRALLCESRDGQGWFGASQSLPLNPTQIAPLVVRGWSKAENVSGTPNNDYSLYVDLLYEDNTPLWGQTANFRCGTHDWEQRELVILPEKPVKTLTLHCLLRGHSGKAWFDDVTVEEIKAEGGAVLFQGVPMQIKPTSTPPPAEMKTFATQDGLKLGLEDNKVSSLQVDGRELAGTAPSGFLARDVAANSDLCEFQQGACPELGLKIKSEFTAQPGSLAIQGRLSDTTGKDRAVLLLFALPVDATGWRWGDDIRRERLVQGGGEFANNVAVRCGTTGTMALYPLASLCDERTGLALALDMAHAAQYRLTYHAGTKQLFIAYDFGLVPESERFPGSADFRFVLFRFEPRWGFRAAWQKLMQIFPDYFTVRSKEQGIWMPFSDVGKVEGWQDFGFRYHEGNNNVPWDDEHDVLSFRYTEPMTWWMSMKKDLPRTEAEAARIRDEMAQGTNGSQRSVAQASQVAGMLDEDGKPLLQLRHEPWCDGAVWSLNPNPALPGALNAATVHWSHSIKQNLYGPKAKGALDGEYLDSLEGYVTADLNFRRDHFHHTTVPLTFASDTKHPALFKGLAVFEFTKWFCEDVHHLGKLTFANGVPYRFSFLCPWLDVMGTETDWLQGGNYRPASDPQMSLWRTMSGQKPYLLLMNTDYDTFTPDLVQRYFQRSLFYGIFPSMFSHNASENPYWQNPKWYNRDRSLFKKYLPLIKTVAEAGWQPVTGATCDNASLLVERFGPSSQGAVYLTFFNDTAKTQSVIWKLDPAVLGAADPPQVQSELSAKAPEKETEGWRISLQPQEVEVIELSNVQPAPATNTPPSTNTVAGNTITNQAPPTSTSTKTKDPIDRIREEGLEHSQVMETLSYLTDVIGPRLTGSPNLKRANEWTQQKLAGWGLTNAHLEAWGPFGRGWSLKQFSAQVIEPQAIPLIGYPKAWSPGLAQPLMTNVVYLDAQAEADLEKYKGKLKGAIVLASPTRELKAHFEPLASRMAETNLLRLANASEQPGPSRRFSSAGATNLARFGGGSGRRAAAGGGPDNSMGPTNAPGAGGPDNRGAPRNRSALQRRILSFLSTEGAALAISSSSQGDGGTIFVSEASIPGFEGRGTNAPTNAPRVWSTNAPAILPQVTLAAEDYNRLVRMIQQGEKLKMAVDLAVEFQDSDPMAYNTIAEIPGSDLKDQIVMLGAHIDSWHSGTGATDNGAGVAAVMEAVRILTALKLQPRRTIRVGLWSGEEQGLFGSKAYVSNHFGFYATQTNAPVSGTGSAESASTNSRPRRTLVRQREYELLSVYFNLDNGTGKIRGVYMQGNEAVRPLFRRWLLPFADLEAETLTLSNTGGTDHTSFDAIGLPGFQFIQDPIEYSSRTHHSNEDVYDRIQADDLKQGAAILAAFTYQAATMDEKVPRKPMPE